MQQPFFSIIVPTYNRARFIKATLESVIDQSFKDFELIVIDDGSTDDTKGIVDSIADHRIAYYYTENRERGAARNHGISLAKGKYITFLDSDDLFYKDHLEVAFNFIESAQPKVFFQQYEIIDRKGRSLLPYLPKREPINRELVLKGNFMSCHGVFLHANLARVHKFNPNRQLAGSEDYELWLRIASIFPIDYSSRVTNALQFHDDRSVLNYEPQRLIDRKELMLDLLESNPLFMKAYGKYWSKIQAEAFSYIALHLALMKERKRAFKYLLRSFGKNLLLLFRKRSLATTYRILFA